MEIYSVDPIVSIEQRGRPKGSVAQIREVHHTVARLTARGVKPPEIGRMINRTGATVRNWLANPAMVELVSQYAGEREAELLSEFDYSIELKRRLRTLADEEMARRLDEAPQDVPWAQLIKLSGDMSDRTGVAKQETKVNVNFDLGTRLDQAIERSKAAKEEAPPSTNVVKLRRV